MHIDSKKHNTPTDANNVLADVVSLEDAKKLSRFGWKKGQTLLNYEKSSRSSVYTKTDKNYIVFGYDAPNKNELKQMCYAVGKVDLSDELSVSELASELIGYCKRQRLNLSDYYIR